MIYKIMLVEDEPTMRRLMSMLLKRKGHELIEAENGEKVVDLALQHQPDIILLDIMMPVVDGFETLRRLQANPETESIPVIFLSAKSQVGDRVEGLRLGADDYLVKPADPAELMARIEAVMARARRDARRRKGKVFGFVGAKGGVGTTTVALNMGAHFQQTGKQALMVDLHLAFGNLANLLGLDPAPQSIANLALMPPEEIDEHAIEQAQLQHASGLRVLASPPSVPTGITFSAEHLMAIIEKAAYSAPFVLVDLPTDPDILEVVADQLHGIILVLGNEPASLAAVEQLGAHLGNIGLHNRLSTLLVHRERLEQQFVTSNLVQETLDCLFLGAIPSKPECYLKAEYTKTPVLFDPESSSEQTIYQKLEEKLLSYVDIIDQFQKEQLMRSRRLA